MAASEGVPRGGGYPSTGDDGAVATDERQQRIDLATRKGLVARAVAVAANFATVPLVLTALDTGGFGVWAAITSVLSLLLFLDFGVGNGAMGRITEAIAHDDDERVGALLRSSYCILFGITAVVWLGVFLAWVTGAADFIARATGSFLLPNVDLVLAFVVAYALVVPATFVQRLMFAYQRAGDATQAQCTFSVVYLVWAAAGAKEAMGLHYFVLGFVGLMFAVYTGYSVHFIREYCAHALSIGRLDRALMRQLVKDAGLFFMLQVTVALVYNSDPLILSTVVPADDVALYAATFKMFTIVTMVNGLMLGPLWPAVSDALARGDAHWIRQAYMRNLRRCMIVSVSVAAVILLLGPVVLHLWTHSRIQASWTLLALMATWVILDGYGQCMAMVLNGMRIIRLQLGVATVLLVVGTFLKWELAQRLGLYGPLLGTIVAFVLVVAIVETLYINRLMAKI